MWKKICSGHAGTVSQTGKSGNVDHPYPVQTDHPKLTSISLIKKVGLIC